MAVNTRSELDTAANEHEHEVLLELEKAKTIINGVRRKFSYILKYAVQDKSKFVHGVPMANSLALDSSPP